MYYLLLDGTQSGPFTLAQLIEMWQARRITPVTLYWEEGNADWLPLHNIAPLLEVPQSRPPSADPPPVLPAVPAPVASPAMTAHEEILYDEHPSLWMSFWPLFWGFLFALILIGIPLLIHVFWRRNAMRYRVTNRRVTIETGIFTRTSRELRIEDIRSIAARANIFGIGNVVFSTAARDDADVVFWGIRHVDRVRDLVKKLQNELG